MNWKLPAFILAVTVLTACNKDKFNSKPSLKLKSVSDKTVQVNGTMVFDFEFTDKEGDVNDTLFVKRIRTNQRKVTTLRDSLQLQVPDFPKQMQGTIEVTMDYNNYLTSANTPPKVGNPPQNESDSMTFKFVLKDKQKNVSDTVTVENIIIKR
jgi:hypothetical protein